MNKPPTYPPHMLKPFEGCDLKVTRALRHLNELAHVIVNYSKAARPTFSDFQQNGLTKLVLFDPPPPNQTALIFGDFVHNLRAALDIAVVDIARLRGKSLDKVKFPFAETKEKFKSTIENFNRLGADFVEAISALEPYRGGNDRLRLLHDLDIDDKHKLVIPVFSAATMIMDGDRIMADAMAAQMGATLVEFKREEFGSLHLSRGPGDATIVNVSISGRPHPTEIFHGERAPVPPSGDESEYYFGFEGHINAVFPRTYDTIALRPVLEVGEELFDTTAKVLNFLRGKFG